MLTFKILQLLCFLCTYVFCYKYNTNVNDVQMSERFFNKSPEQIQSRNDFMLNKQIIHGRHNGAKMIKHVLKPSLRYSTNSGGRKKKTILIASPSKKVQKFINYSQHLKSKPTEEVYHTYVEEHVHVDEYGKPIPGMKAEFSKIRHVIGHSTAKPHKNNSNRNKFLKEIEQREEQKVEATMDSLLGGKKEIEIIDGKPFMFSNGWKPIEDPISLYAPPKIEIMTTEKPQIKSVLHTSIMEEPISKQVEHETHVIVVKPFSLENHKEISPAKNIQEHEPRLIQEENEKPNYPEYFLKKNKHLENSKSIFDTDELTSSSSQISNIKTYPSRAKDVHQRHKKNKKRHNVPVEILTTPPSSRNDHFIKLKAPESNPSSSLFINVNPEKNKTQVKQKRVNNHIKINNESSNRPTNIIGRGTVKYENSLY